MPSSEGSLGVAGIVIEPTKDLLRLQQKLIDVVAPYTVEKGTDAAFVPKPDGGAMGSGTHQLRRGVRPQIQRQELQPARHHRARHPRVPRQAQGRALPVVHVQGARAVAVYQLGDFGTAQKLLWTSAPADPLSSWNDGKAKQAILDFVAKVTKEGGPDFVPVANFASPCSTTTVPCGRRIHCRFSSPTPSTN